MERPAAESDRVTVIHRIEGESILSVIPEKACSNEVRMGSLVKIELSDRSLTRPIGVIYRTGKHFSPAAEKFIEYLQAESLQGDPQTPESEVAKTG